MNKRLTINPYLLSIAMILKRFTWDVHPESWRSRNRIKARKNSHIGDKAIIICNGPSLLDVDLSKMNGIYTFGLNKINLLFKKTDFRPSSIVAVNSFVLDQNVDFYNSTDIHLFLSSYAKKNKLLSKRIGVDYLHLAGGNFAQDCSMSISEGHTVTYVAMQLAFHMGFSKVALVGADHNFASKGPANKVVTSGSEDPNHFDKAYFSGGVKWQLPDLIGSEVSYLKAKQAYESDGRGIYNCTSGGDLEIFERVSLDEFINY